MQVVFSTDLLIALGHRANAAAAAGAKTFSVPEFELVAAAIAADRRVERTSDAARRWGSDGASYHDLVRLCAGYVMELEAIVPAGEPVYVPKVRDELEPLLALWPHVLALPTIDHLPARDLLRLRAFPVHPLGVTGKAVWADGLQVSPAEFFFHDLDHARYKVREDLLAMGVHIRDAYQDGTTFDPVTGRHRSILPEAFGKVGPSLWSIAADRCSLVEDFSIESMRCQTAHWLMPPSGCCFRYFMRRVFPCTFQPCDVSSRHLTTSNYSKQKLITASTRRTHLHRMSWLS